MKGILFFQKYLFLIVHKRKLCICKFRNKVIVKRWCHFESFDIKWYCTVVYFFCILYLHKMPWLYVCNHGVTKNEKLKATILHGKMYVNWQRYQIATETTRRRPTLRRLTLREKYIFYIDWYPPPPKKNTYTRKAHGISSTTTGDILTTIKYRIQSKGYHH